MLLRSSLMTTIAQAVHQAPTNIHFRSRYPSTNKPSPLAPTMFSHTSTKNLINLFVCDHLDQQLHQQLRHGQTWRHRQFHQTHIPTHNMVCPSESFLVHMHNLHVTYAKFMYDMCIAVVVSNFTPGHIYL